MSDEPNGSEILMDHYTDTETNEEQINDISNDYQNTVILNTNPIIKTKKNVNKKSKASVIEI